MLESYDAATDLIRRRIAAGRKTFCVAINPAKIYAANRDPKLKRVLDAAHLHICDGIGAALAMKLIYGAHVPRCTGIELFRRVAGMAAREGWGIYLLGASPRSSLAAAQRLQETYPGLRIVGRRDGYFKDPDKVVAAINDSGADLLFVAMGSPRQELWIGERLFSLHVRFCMGVGGSLDVLSGTVKGAPPVFRKTGAEWLYRALRQPSRIPRLWTNALFVLDVLKAIAGGRGAEALPSR